MLVTRMVSLGLAGLALVTAAPALADSRLFSIQTDIPGLTVTDARQGGTPLAVAGSSGDVTFFRIDNPAGAVPCSATLTLGISDGSSLTRTIDFCAQNWDVTVVLTEASPSPGGTQVTVTTDDPSAVITSVFVAGEEVPLATSPGPAVAIATTALGISGGCERDMAVGLADGRLVARVVNICVGGNVITVPLIGASAPGEGEGPPPLPTPADPQPPAAAMVWSNNVAGNRATLTFGIPQTDAGEFTAVCEVGSAVTRVILSRSAPGLNPGAPIAIRFTAGGFDATYSAVGSAISELSGVSHPQLELATSDSFWPALIRENVLDIRIGNLPPFSVSLKGSAVNARAFLANCNPRPPTPPQQPQNPGTVAFVCNDGSSFSAAFGLNSARVFEAGEVTLAQVQSEQGDRFVAADAELIGSGEQITWRRVGFPDRTCAPQ